MTKENKTDNLSSFFFKWQLEFEEDLVLNNKDEKTISSYKTVISYFVDFCEKYNHLRIKDIDIKLIKYYFSWRDENFKNKTGKYLENSTKLNDKKVLMIFFDFIEETSFSYNKNITFNIKWKNLKFKKIIKEKDYYPNDIQELFLKYFKKIIRKDKNDYSYTISLCFKLGLYCGLRASEICNLRLSNFSKPYNTELNIKLIDIKIYGKGHTILTNPLKYEYINDELNYFKKNRTNEQFLFYSKTEKKLNRFTLYRYIEEIANELNINDKGVHKIRHTFANNLANKGLDLMDIQDLMRHSDPSTTRIYTKRNKSRLQNAAAIL